LILPAGAEAVKMISEITSRGFFLTRRTEVWSTPKSGPKRLLVEFSRPETTLSDTTGEPPITPELSRLVIEDAGPGTFSTEYRALTRDFYLYF
jgi:tRNA1(Val) A37 N6-methylase TrmN6